MTPPCKQPEGKQLVEKASISGRFVGNGLDRSVQLGRQYDVSGNSAPFGAIECAARSQRCGAVKTRALHYYPIKGFLNKL